MPPAAEDLRSFYEDAYRTGIDGEKYGRLRDLNAVTKADHVVELARAAALRVSSIADVGCRNTVYNGQAQSAAEYIPRMRELGLAHFRIELLRERAHEVGPLLRKYADLLTGREEPRAVLRSLRVLHQLGVTAGTLDRE